MAFTTKTPAISTASGLQATVNATLNAFTTAINSLNSVATKATEAITTHKKTIESLEVEIAALEEQKTYAAKVAEKLSKLTED